MEAGYTVELDVWDWTPGQDFVTRMQAALGRADRLLAVWTPGYFQAPFAGVELRAAFVRQAQDEGRIVPVLVEPTTVPDLYASLIYLDLVGLDEAAADRLRRHPDWLLIFDNAERAEELLPSGGTGHVLVTSRRRGWARLGGQLDVDVFDRAETGALLRRRLPGLAEALADQLAAELGDLPLAADAYIEQTGLPTADYLRQFRTRRDSLLAKGEVVGYQGQLDTAWQLSADRLDTDSPAAAQLLQLAAFFAPEPVALPLVGSHPELLAEPLRTTAADPDDLDDDVGVLVGYSLAHRAQHSIQLHRLLQAAIRHHLPTAQQQSCETRMLGLLAAADPGDPDKSLSHVDGR